MYEIKVNSEKRMGCGDRIDICPEEICEQEAITVTEI